MTIEQRFDRTPDGAVWAPRVFSQAFWSRYLDVFDAVTVVARVNDVSGRPTVGHRADSDLIRFVGLPNYIGPFQYLQNRKNAKKALKTPAQSADATIFRVPSQIATSFRSAMDAEKPFGVEVVGDPHDTFSRGSVTHSLRPVFRAMFVHQLREQCLGAAAVAYVTRDALQRRYPSHASSFTTHYSSIELTPKHFASAAKSTSSFLFGARPIRVIFVGTVEQLYKAPDVLIDALAAVSHMGANVHLTLIGGGSLLPELRGRALQSGLSDKVHFTGWLQEEDHILKHLDASDLFVLPSRQEGLPRAMIEAMACGLPCIGSTVGGIPELLPAEDLVPPGDAPALARKIMEVLGDPDRMARMSASNLDTAAEYRDDILSERRRAFYTYLRDRTQAWMLERDDA